MHIEKARLPKTLSYPATSSQVEAALAEASVDLDTQLIFSMSAIFFDAHFWPANRRIPNERLYIRVGAVKAAEAHTARLFMAQQALPSMVTAQVGSHLRTSVVPDHFRASCSAELTYGLGSNYNTVPAKKRLRGESTRHNRVTPSLRGSRLRLSLRIVAEGEPVGLHLRIFAAPDHSLASFGLRIGHQFLASSGDSSPSGKATRLQ